MSVSGGKPCNPLLNKTEIKVTLYYDHARKIELGRQETLIVNFPNNKKNQLKELKKLLLPLNKLSDKSGSKFGFCRTSLDEVQLCACLLIHLCRERPTGDVKESKISPRRPTVEMKTAVQCWPSKLLEFMFKMNKSSWQRRRKFIALLGRWPIGRRPSSCDWRLFE